MEDHTAAELRRLGAAIRKARQTQGASQETLAELADIDRTWISRIERGRVNLSWESLSRIARALRRPPSALLREAGM